MVSIEIIEPKVLLVNKSLIHDGMRDYKYIFTRNVTD